MKLLINAGNTNITLGVGHDDIVMYEKIRRVDETGFVDVLRDIKSGYDIKSIVMASVVPSHDDGVLKLIESVFAVTVHELTLADVPLDYSSYASSLGLDRALTAYAALSRYPQPFIVFDLGTATSVQVVAHNKLVGGVIMSGLRMGLESLNLKTDLLPLVDELEVQSVIAKDTKSNIISGAIFGTIGAIEGVGERIESELRSECTWILTGGNTRYIKPHLYLECEIDMTLLLQGMLDIANLK